MRTALVFDIDGVVCPAGRDAEGLVEVGMALHPVLVQPDICAAITALTARPGILPLWLTSWLPETRQAMRPPFPGATWPQIELLPTRDAGWPKWHALTAWLAGQPQLTRLAWIDDEINDNHPSQLRRRGLDVLALAPAAEEGLTLAGLAVIADWLSSHAGTDSTIYHH